MKHIGQLATILTLGAFLAGAVVMAALPAPAPAPPPRIGLYHWAHGAPVGFTFADLQHRDLTPGSMISIERHLDTAKSLGANTIRLQVIQDHLVGRGGRKFDTSYMSYIQRTVAYGRAIGLRMVINDQTEPARGYHANEGYPTHATTVFWRRMTDAYANQRGIVFDLFNETRHLSREGWQHKMQALVTMIRHRAHNTIWLEGYRWASTLAGVPMLTGGHLVYTYHHPGAPWAGQSEHTPAVWDASFGNLAWQRVPVVDAEYTDNARTYHMPRRVVGSYLRYAKRHHIGMLVYGLRQRRLLARYLAA